jgi:hypothetical protein
VTGYSLDGRVSIFLFSTASRLALGLSQPLVQWLPGIKQLQHEADHSPPSSLEVKNGGGIPPLPTHLHGVLN